MGRLTLAMTLSVKAGAEAVALALAKGVAVETETGALAFTLFELWSMPPVLSSACAKTMAVTGERMTSDPLEGGSEAWLSQGRN